jgi:hypothetical protein
VGRDHRAIRARQHGACVLKIKPPASDTRADELQADFDKFHAEHPEVLELYCSLTLEFIREGINDRPVSKLPPRFPLDTIRATSRVGDKGKNRFRINANHGRFYADLFKARHPEAAYIFDSRERTSKRRPASKLPPLGPDDYQDADE